MPKSNKNDIRPTKANDSISSDKYEFSNNKDKKKKIMRIKRKFIIVIIIIIKKAERKYIIIMKRTKLGIWENYWGLKLQKIIVII